MPSLPSKDVAHTQVTDHRIPRRPETALQLQDVNPQHAAVVLVPFPASEEAKHDVRDLALAWESLAENGMAAAVPEAERLLRAAATLSANDSVVLSALGYVEQKRGAVDRARQLYQKALALDPDLIDAATNLGVIEAKRGDLDSALKLWEGAFERAPWRGSIGMNIARVFCEGGQFKEAQSYILRVLEFSPDQSSAKYLLRQINADTPSCGY
jgi:Flp pilus assembly protein TadD